MAPPCPSFSFLLLPLSLSLRSSSPAFSSSPLPSSPLLAPSLSRSGRCCLAVRSSLGNSPSERTDMAGGEEEERYHVVEYKGERVRVKDGELLRSALLRSSLSPHNRLAQTVNCRGLGTCGTCAVRVEGEVAPATWNGMEKARLHFPPYSANNNKLLRLACQVDPAAMPKAEQEQQEMEQEERDLQQEKGKRRKRQRQRQR
eukprot:762474-Hanusia_phi.AAC.3